MKENTKKGNPFAILAYGITLVVVLFTAPRTFFFAKVCYYQESFQKKKIFVDSIRYSSKRGGSSYTMRSVKDLGGKRIHRGNYNGTKSLMREDSFLVWDSNAVNIAWLANKEDDFFPIKFVSKTYVMPWVILLITYLLAYPPKNIQKLWSK